MASKCGQNWKKGYMSRRRVYYTPFLVFTAFWSVFSPHVRKSRFHAVDSGFQVMDSGFQTLVGFRAPWAVFRIPKPKIRIPQAKISLIPESRFLTMGRGLLWSITEQTHGNTESIRCIQWSEKRKGHTVEPPLNGHLLRASNQSPEIIVEKNGNVNLYWAATSIKRPQSTIGRHNKSSPMEKVIHVSVI